MAERPHTFLPMQAFAEADKPSQLFQYFLGAQLRAAGADAASARTQLSHLRIVAPISGRTGAITVHRGVSLRPAPSRHW